MPTKITRTSILTGKVRTLELPVSPSELAAYYGGSGDIQEVLTQLTSEEREFIMTGITPDEWDMVAEPENDG